MAPSPSIVIVDDAPEVRALVRARFRIDGRLDVVGEGADGAAALALAGELRPDLMLLDVSMPGTDGLEALPLVRAASPATRVVMYSGFDEEGLAEHALGLGAAAFLEKSTSLDRVVDALVDIHAAATGTAAASIPEDRPAPGGGHDRHPGSSVLDEHLERFREVFEDAAIGMATMTLSGRLVRVNQSLAHLVDRAPSDLVGTSYAELVTEDGLLAGALHAILVDGQDVAELEHTVRGAGVGRRLLATATPVRDSARRPLYVFLQVQDVSRQRGAEHRLRQTETRFRMLVDAVDDYAIFMLDADGTIASWNSGAQRNTGYGADEVVGRHFRMFYPPEQQEARHPEHELALATRDGHYEEEGWRVRKDGSEYWAAVTLSAVRDATGTLIGFAKVTRDVTARRRADEELRQSEQRFRLLVEAVEDYAIFMLGPGGHIASWNAGAQRSKGYTAEEILGQHFRIFYPRELQVARHPEHELELALRDGRYEEEGWRIRKDGTSFWAHVTITRVLDQDGALVGFAKVTRDISERLAMQQQQQRSAAALAAANEQLEAANAELISTADDQAHFLAVTAHELRSPVGVLGMSAETLSRHWEQLDAEERAELFEGMTNSSARLRRLLADLLTASRIQASALDLQPAALLVEDELARATAAVKRVKPGAAVEPTVEEGLTVVADSGRLGQALENLLLNALRHGAPPVSVHARAVADPRRPERESVEIAVRDGGGGVPSELRERLFQRFATGDRGGTGLGLYIVRELARAHGGEAAYRPEDRAFVITLPRHGAPSRVGSGQSDLDEERMGG